MPSLPSVQTRSPGNNIADIANADVVNNTDPSHHINNNVNSINRSSTSAVPEVSPFSFDPGATNPWLSWGWTDPSWGLLDFVPSTEPDLDHDQSIDGMAGVFFDAQSLGSVNSSHIASIVDARLDPVEYHRQCILRRLEQSSITGPNGDAHFWLSRTQFPLLLKTYFVRHHRHTPIIHLPTLNIAECPTSLIFALVLIAASSLPKLELRSKELVALAECAYQLAIEYDGVC